MSRPSTKPASVNTIASFPTILLSSLCGVDGYFYYYTSYNIISQQIYWFPGLGGPGGKYK